MADTALIDVPNLNWPFSVLSSTSTPPGSPSLGDCYLVGASPTGAWSGHANAIARWNDSSAWEFQAPTEGRTVWNVATDLWLTWNGSAWANANPLPTGGTTGQVLAKTSNSDYAIGWSTVASGGATTIYFFLSSGSINNGTGAIGDIAIVGGSPNGLWYKDGTNTWVYGGPVATSGGTITGITTAAGSGLAGGGTSGTLTLTVDVHSQTSKASPVAADEVIVGDSAASYALKRATVGSLTQYGTTSTTACVGNDSRLSDARDPIIHTQTSKTTPVGADEIVIADSAASYALKRATLTSALSGVSTVTVKKAGTTIATRSAINLIEGSNVTITAADDSGNDRVNVTIASSGGGGGSTFDPTVDINPRHYWRASGTVQTSGLVDTITDIGRVGGKSFTQTGTPRCPTATDGNGKTYLAPDGANDYYQAGVAADWKFLSDGSQWTMVAVVQRTSLVTGTEVLCETSALTRVNVGFGVNIGYTSSTVQGWESTIYMAGGTNVSQYVEFKKPRTDLTVIVLKHVGDDASAVNPGTLAIPQDFRLRVGGQQVAHSVLGAGYSNTNPANTLTLFARYNAGSPNMYSSMRLYEMWIDDKLVPDRLIHKYEEWAASSSGYLAVT